METQVKKPTEKQLRAISNIIRGWKITDKKLLRKPKTLKGAQDLISELVAEVEKIKAGLAWDRGSDEWDDPLYACMDEAGYFH